MKIGKRFRNQVVEETGSKNVAFDEGRGNDLVQVIRNLEKLMV